MTSPQKSKETFERYTITSALPYANGPVHIGHLAGVYVPADIYSRFLRLKGKDVIFIGGSDEHGVPITIKARKEGKTPQDIVDKYHNMIAKSFEEFGISFDVYSRTSNTTHHETASRFFESLYEKGKLIEQESEQFFDEKNQQFLADRYITGTCPHCSYEKAYGDQCENCGTSLSPDELKNPVSVLSGSKPVRKNTKHWYLPLQDYEGMLTNWILEGHKNDWKNNVYGQCKSWIDQGLKPRAVTRDLDWGVKVPLGDAKGKVLYVWFDAPIGYISATREWGIEKKKQWEPYWKSDKSKLVHFIGKDNIVFHCIIFPVMLFAEGSYILPDNVPANEFLNLEGDKISTSRNWAVWLHEYLVDFPNQQDILRYTLCAAAPETKDNDFTWKDFQARNNNELVAIFGNFINRTLVLTHKYYNGIVPQMHELLDEDQDVLNNLKHSPYNIEISLEKYKFREALNEMMNLARLGNKYLTDNEPWKKTKTDPQRVMTIMNISLRISAALSILAEPFLPFSASKLRKMMNIKDKKWDISTNDQLIQPGHEIGKPELLFQKIEDDKIQQQIDKLLKTREQNLMEENNIIKEFKEDIVFDEFVKMDMRVATILNAEKVVKTKKLMKVVLDVGKEERIVVSGIAEQFSPEEINGKKVVYLANLQSKKIKGIQSQGMILMASDPNGKLSFIQPSDNLPNGSIIS